MAVPDQSNNTNPQQAFPSNPFYANSTNGFQHSPQMQPQMGMINPQISMPLNNMPMPNLSQPCFMNVTNTHHPFQNNHMVMPQLGPVGHMPRPNQLNGGFGPQNVNFMVQGQLASLAQGMNQQPGQFHPHNLLNLAQQLNCNLNLPNGQLYFQNSFQNAHHLMSLQMPQPVPYNVPMLSNNMFGAQNQAGQGMGYPPAFFVNPHFGSPHSYQAGQQVNPNQQNLVRPSMGVDIASPQLHGNSSATQIPCSSQQQLIPNALPSGFTRTQGAPVKNGMINTPSPHWKNSPRKNFTNNQEMSLLESQKSQFRQMKNGKRKFMHSNEQKGKGMNNERAGNVGFSNSTNHVKEKKRCLTYTEQEIHQWREQRKKNFPSKVNTEKKLAKSLEDSEVIDREAKLRREQLKDILTKQAELGVEVAEIPSCYLSDSEKQVHEKEDTRRQSTRVGRFKNKYDKRGRYDKRNHFVENQNLGGQDSFTPPPLKTPTLLQKLLSEDVRRDKSRLLQVFRFMVMNSFFEDLPQKPLEFPPVLGKESGSLVEAIGKEPSFMGLDDSVGNKLVDANDDNNDDDNENSEDDSQD